MSTRLLFRIPMFSHRYNAIYKSISKSTDFTKLNYKYSSDSILPTDSQVTNYH